jgi:RNA polymerase sigma factor (sigma-70 family)
VTQAVHDGDGRTSATSLLSRGGDLRGWVRRLVRAAHDVEDVLQETYLRVWIVEQRGELRDGADGLARTVAANVARDRRRRDRARAVDRHEPLDEAVPDAGPDPERQTLWAEALLRLERTLDDLDTRSRAAFLLRHVEGLAVEEIARRLHVSLRTAERDLARAQAHCIARLPDLAQGVGG